LFDRQTADGLDNGLCVRLADPLDELDGGVRGNPSPGVTYDALVVFFHSCSGTLR